MSVVGVWIWTLIDRCAILVFLSVLAKMYDYIFSRKCNEANKKDFGDGTMPSSRLLVIKNYYGPF